MAFEPFHEERFDQACVPQVHDLSSWVKQHDPALFTGPPTQVNVFDMKEKIAIKSLQTAEVASGDPETGARDRRDWNRSFRELLVFEVNLKGAKKRNSLREPGKAQERRYRRHLVAPGPTLLRAIFIQDTSPDQAGAGLTFGGFRQRLNATRLQKRIRIQKYEKAPTRRRGAQVGAACKPDIAVSLQQPNTVVCLADSEQTSLISL